MLDAVEPWSFTPPDMRETERRLEAAVKKYPHDAELAYQFGLKLRDDDPRAIAAFEAAAASDPTFAMAWCMKGRARFHSNDSAGAVEAYGACLKISPGGTSCLEDLATLQATPRRVRADGEHDPPPHRRCP